jgi:hypothetical protein
MTDPKLSQDLDDFERDGMKVLTRPVWVEAVRFDEPANPTCPNRPFELAPCGCDAMDGHTCGRHRKPPQYSYGVNWFGRRWLAASPGDWWVRWPNGTEEVYSGPKFHETFDAAPLVGQKQE